MWGLISEMRVEVSANGKTTAQGDCLGLLDYSAWRALWRSACTCLVGLQVCW